MRITVGTFNLNNLFSRWNFKGKITKDDYKLKSTVEYNFTDSENYKIRTYKGKLVEEKPEKDRGLITKRIEEMDIDTLAVQEVEDIDTLKSFNRESLNNLYPYQVLVEGNDPRLIDIGLLSKYPIGAVISWQKATHPSKPEDPIFSRDLLEVEIMNKERSQILFTLFNNHLKSNYIPWDAKDKEREAQEANEQRKRQAETIARIIKAKIGGGGSFIVLGDMNDTEKSEWIEPFTKDPELKLTNALMNAEETRPAKSDDPPPSTNVWTHRYKPTGKSAEYLLYDQIWLSQSLADKLQEAKIDRRTKHSGDGSDHDPAWITLEI